MYRLLAPSHCLYRALTSCELHPTILSLPSPSAPAPYQPPLTIQHTAQQQPSSCESQLLDLPSLSCLTRSLQTPSCMRILGMEAFNQQPGQLTAVTNTFQVSLRTLNSADRICTPSAPLLRLHPAFEDTSGRTHLDHGL